MNNELPWWVMLIAFPLIAATVVLAPGHFPGSLGSSLALVACAAAAYLGIHTEVPKWLKSRPGFAKLTALASGGLLVKLAMVLPFIADTRVQTAAWLFLALLSYLAGKPLTVSLEGKALPTNEG